QAPHVSQICHWDCGVSCAQMVLRGLGREAERSSLLASLGTRSVWTIDLAMLLHRQGVRRVKSMVFMYGTRTAGVTEAYSTIDFYRANFDHDAPRVQSLFKAAEEANVGAVQKAFSWQELAVLVSSYNYAAIVLVDSRYLHPTSYRGSTAAAAAPALTPPAPVLGPPSPLLAPPSPAAAASAVELTPPAQSWSTPKRHREEAEDEGGVRGWGGSGELSAGAGDGARRRRKRPAAARATPIDDSPCGPGMTLGTASGATAALPAPLSARDANTGHLRLSPAVGGDMAMFVTPPAPKSGRKYLAGDLGASSGAGGTAGVISQQGGENGRRDDRASAEPPVQRTTTPPATVPVSPPFPFHAPSPAGSPRGSPPPILVASPPPLKAAAGLVSPPPAGGGDGGAASPPKDSSYCGHYILLVGWSEADGVFIARDPALPSSTPSTAAAAARPGGAAGGGGRGGDPNAHACIALTPEALDRARRSY
ncbi:unnamed protein product, partial [Ectocarpus fasciculatus]